MDITIIGIDCATQDSKVGMALAERSGIVSCLIDASCGGSRLKPSDQIAQWIKGRRPTLIALDAPLGWPAPLADQLPRHLAGSPFTMSANELFRRNTDEFVRETIGKRPLEVGADRIARTAVSALRLLADLREILSDPIPLAWSERGLEPVSAIEVYPAATLKARSLQSEGYKGANEYSARKQMLQVLERDLEIGMDPSEILTNDNVFDAVVCVLAGIDFIDGRSVGPLDREIAEKEGWIWFIDPAKISGGTSGGDA